MLCASATLLRTGALLFLLASAVEALAITSPSVTTIWDVTGTNPNYVFWQLYPLTNPAPATQYFDVYMRNAVEAMYNPPLNIKLASSVDSISLTYLQVEDVQKFVAGPGYQLFFADPADPANVYCDSDVFSIGTPNVGEAPLTPSSSSESLPSTSASSSSSTSASSSVTSSLVPSSITTTATDELVPTRTKGSSDGTLVAATVPGGPAEQGFNLLSGAAGFSWSAAGGLGCMGATMMLLLA
ncbi:hypothetical protein JCM10213v2_002985 [Rhodosporidiobolus nylandii]